MILLFPAAVIYTEGGDIIPHAKLVSPSTPFLHDYQCERYVGHDVTCERYVSHDVTRNAAVILAGAVTQSNHDVCLLLCCNYRCHVM